MDVRAWLQNTADREPPDEEDRAGFPNYLQPARYTAEEHTRVNQSKRKRASSEPPSVQRQPSRGRHGGHEECDSSSDHVRGDHSATASSSSSSSDECREPTPDRRFNRTFERRARHKTKEDRYEPKAKKRRKEHESRKDRKAKEKSKSKRRKSHRSGDGTRTAGLVTSFQLKDRPKNNRLTLRPADVSAGIFKHGRAGAPIPERRTGLPDLVFNEMRFLRRPREHQDEITPNHPDQDRETTDAPQEGNISTYFSKPPPEPPRSHEQHRADPALDQSSRQRPQDVDEIADVSTCQRAREVEVVGDRAPNSFLGFGSRGPNQEHGASNRRGNSCYTWSESVPAPRSPMKDKSAQATKPRTHGATHPDTATATRPRSTRRAGERSEDLFARPSQGESAGRWVYSKRGKGSASAEVYQPAAPVHTSCRGNGLPIRHKSSMSLPRSALGSPVPPGHAIFAGRIPGSCPTSDILRIRDHRRDDEEQPTSCHSNLPSHGYRDKENQEPSTSTPTSKLLRRAFHTITGPHTSQPRNAHEPPLDDFEGHKRSPYLAQPSDDTVHPSRMVADYQQGPYRPSPEKQPFSMPERGFSRSTDASRAKQQHPTARPATRAFGFTTTAPVFPRSYHGAYQNYGPSPDDEMLDNFANYQLIPLGQQHTFTNSRQAEELVRRLTSNQREESGVRDEAGPGSLPTPSDGQGDFGHHLAEVDGGSYMRTDSEVAETLTGRPYDQKWSNNDAPHSALDPGGDTMQRDSMPGFWRANKLY